MTLPRVRDPGPAHAHRALPGHLGDEGLAGHDDLHGGASPLACAGATGRGAAVRGVPGEPAVRAPDLDRPTDRARRHGRPGDRDRLAGRRRQLPARLPAASRRGPEADAATPRASTSRPTNAPRRPRPCWSGSSPASRRPTSPRVRSAATCSAWSPCSATWCCCSWAWPCYRRWRQRSQHVVVEVRGDDVVLESAGGQVTVVGPDGWAQRVRAGQRVTGGLHLATDEEVVTGSVVGGLEQVRGASYVVRGRVVDARAGQADRSSSTTAPGSASRPGRTASGPTSATPPRSTARSASPRRLHRGD